MSDGRPHPLVELTRMRVREFLREPEALFWVFAFPVLMACALGVAFRSQEPQPIPVGIQSGHGASDLVRALTGDAQLAVREVGAEDVDRLLRNGTVHLVIVPGDVPAYRFDPTRPETRLARLAADQALQRARGRTDAFVPPTTPPCRPARATSTGCCPGCSASTSWAAACGASASRSCRPARASC